MLIKCGKRNWFTQETVSVQQTWSHFPAFSSHKFLCRQPWWSLPSSVYDYQTFSHICWLNFRRSMCEQSKSSYRGFNKAYKNFTRQVWMEVCVFRKFSWSYKNSVVHGEFLKHFYLCLKWCSCKKFVSWNYIRLIQCDIAMTLLILVNKDLCYK